MTLQLAKASNKYIDETVPWALAKNEEQKRAGLGTVLYNLFEAIRFVAVQLKPFTPDTARKAIFGPDRLRRLETTKP